MTLQGLKRRWALACAEARLRRAESAVAAMPYGHFYDLDVDDATYYSRIVELDDARKALKRLREAV